MTIEDFLIRTWQHDCLGSDECGNGCPPEIAQQRYLQRDATWGRRLGRGPRGTAHHFPSLEGATEFASAIILQYGGYGPFGFPLEIVSDRRQRAIVDRDVRARLTIRWCKEDRANQIVLVPMPFGNGRCRRMDATIYTAGAYGGKCGACGGPCGDPVGDDVVVLRTGVMD